MAENKIPEIIAPYKNHPLVRKVDSADMSQLDDSALNEIIRSVDLILRGLRENYFKGQTTKTRLHAGHFSSSVLISRGWLFLDGAHATNDVSTIVERVYANTKTTNRQSAVKNIYASTIPKLSRNGLIKLDESEKKIVDVMPYPVSSKLYVLRELMNNPVLLSNQINQFDILGKIQYFPELTMNLLNDSKNQRFFRRDLEALADVDVIRNRTIKGREFTLAKAYLLDDKTSYDIWATVLETGDQVRQGLKNLMIFLGQLGGFASQSELARMTTLNMRLVNKLIRRVDNVGLAQRSHTLEMEDALSRPIDTKITLNYHQLKNAESMLTLCRSVPESATILEKLRNDKIIEEDCLIDEFDSSSVGKVRNALLEIGVIQEQSLTVDDMWKMTSKESEDFLLEVLTIAANSRRILGENIEINRKLEDFFKDVDEERLEKTAISVEKDFLDEMMEKKR